MARRQRRRRGSDEPSLTGDGWAPWGGELVWAVGETAGGTPYGLTHEEFCTAQERDDRGARWARAASILRRAMQELAGPRATVTIGRVVRIGSGLSRDLFAAEVEVVPDPQGLSGTYVALLPRQDAVPGLDARAAREVELLERLASLHLPFRVPRIIGVVSETGRPVLVREYLLGIPLDLRAGEQPGEPPWEVVGRVAAAIHGIHLDGFRDILPGHTNRQDHRLAALEVFNGLETSEIREAYAWAREQLASDAPSVFLHGDLLGQNILLRPEAAPAFIDWEYAMRGDPAYDLAIVTRGIRRPFQVDRGLLRLLETYGAAGGQAVTEAQIHFHEICMAAGWYREALRGAGEHGPDQERLRLRGILKRAQAARG